MGPGGCDINLEIDLEVCYCFYHRGDSTKVHCIGICCATCSHCRLHIKLDYFEKHIENHLLNKVLPDNK